MSFQDEVRVLSLGLISRMHLDSVILRDATSLQRRRILMFRVVDDMPASGCWLRICSPNGMSLVLFLASRKCSLKRSLTGLLVSPM